MRTLLVNAPLFVFVTLRPILRISVKSHRMHTSCSHQHAVYMKTDKCNELDYIPRLDILIKLR